MKNKVIQFKTREEREKEAKERNRIDQIKQTIRRHKRIVEQRKKGV